MVENNKEYNENEYFVGFDLCNDYSLISYWDYIKNKPISINPTGGFGSEQIPTVISYHASVNEWLVGEEALQAQENDGYKITNFVDKIGTGQVYHINGKDYLDEDILTIFFEKVLEFITKINPKGIIKSMMISAQSVSANSMKVISKAMENNNVPAENIAIQSHLESGIQYIISEGIPQKRAGIFEMSQLGLKYYQISVKNQSTIWQINIDEANYSEFLNGSLVLDMVKEYILSLYKKATNKITIQKEEEIEIENVYYKNKQFIFSKMAQNQNAKLFFNSTYPPIKIEIEPQILYKRLEVLDSRFERITDRLLLNNQVTAVFLVGSGFEVPWAVESLKSLCKGRRVFQGQNLFCFGACYSAASISGICKKVEKIVTGKGIIAQDYGLMVRVGKEETFVPIITAGTPWYIGNNSIVVMLDDIYEVTIISKGSPMKDQEVCTIKLTNLPKRPNKTTKINVNIEITSENEAKVEIIDIGLGTIYPGSLRKWEQKFNF